MRVRLAGRVKVGKADIADSLVIVDRMGVTGLTEQVVIVDKME